MYVYCMYVSMYVCRIFSTTEEPWYQAVWSAMGISCLGQLYTTVWWEKSDSSSFATKQLVRLKQVGNGSESPYTYPTTTAEYVAKWIQGAKQWYNLDINYVGVCYVVS